MAAKKSGTAKSNASKGKKQPKNAPKSSSCDSTELSGGLSLSDQARLNGKYEKFESLDERVKEVERVKRFIFANLGRTALGMMKSAEKGTNAAGAKLLWEFAEIDKILTVAAAQPEAAQTSTVEGNAPVAVQAEDYDPTKAVRSFYKKLGIEPPKLKPPATVAIAPEDAVVAV